MNKVKRLTKRQRKAAAVHPSDSEPLVSFRYLYPHECDVCEWDDPDAVDADECRGEAICPKCHREIVWLWDGETSMLAGPPE